MNYWSITIKRFVKRSRPKTTIVANKNVVDELKAIQQQFFFCQAPSWTGSNWRAFMPPKIQRNFCQMAPFNLVPLTTKPNGYSNEREVVKQRRFNGLHGNEWFAWGCWEMGMTNSSLSKPNGPTDLIDIIEPHVHPPAGEMCSFRVSGLWECWCPVENLSTKRSIWSSWVIDLKLPDLQLSLPTVPEM